MIDSNIFFVGGIHGVGKTMVCDQLSKALSIERISASSLIGWKEFAESSQSKSVDNIEFTQKRLLLALERNLVKEQSYLLDGHFCLISKRHKIIPVPLNTFMVMKPALICVVTDSPHEIADRLRQRDNLDYQSDFLQKMQEQETAYAKLVAKKLSVPYLESQIDNTAALENQIQLFLQAT